MGEIHELFVLALSLVWFAGATPEYSKVIFRVLEKYPLKQGYKVRNNLLRLFFTSEVILALRGYF